MRAHGVSVLFILHVPRTNVVSIALLFFDTPRGVRFNVSSLASPNAATSYDFGHVGLINGSLSYLYSSLPIRKISQSGQLDLREVVEGYRQVRELQIPRTEWRQIWQGGRQIHKKDTLVSGRLYLPRSTLEAMYLRRLSTKSQIQLSYASDATLPNKATLLALYQRDNAKFSTEYLYSTDGALVGFRGLYNFGFDPTKTDDAQDMSVEQRKGRLSAGGEFYYGILNKTAGMSAGLRFTTLPQHTGFPYTMTLTLNPLMGNLSSSYAVKAGKHLAMCSQFDFNFYSYESGLRLGLELWKMRQPPPETEWARKLLRPEWGPPPTDTDGDVSGVLKARWDQDWRVGVLWEGRVKEMLFSLGVTLDMRNRDQIFHAVGAELQFSS